MTSMSAKATQRCTSSESNEFVSHRDLQVLFGLANESNNGVD